MTFRDSERESIVDELLLDANLTGTHDVHRTLLSLGSFAHTPAPAPTGELAAMLRGPHDELSKRRWRHKHRTAVVSVAVVAAMGLGVSGVAAASSGFTRTPTFIDELLGNLAPQWSATPAVLPTPDAPKVTTEPAPAIDPATVPPASPLVAVPDVAHAAEPGSPAQEPSEAAAPGAILPAPAAAQADPAPEANAAPADRNTPPRNVTPQSAAGNAVAPEPATNADGQHHPVKPNQAKPNRAADAKPGTAVPTKPAKAAPGAQGNKNGQGAGEHVPSFVDKLKQWLKQTER